MTLVYQAQFLALSTIFYTLSMPTNPKAKFDPKTFSRYFSGRRLLRERNIQTSTMLISGPPVRVSAVLIHLSSNQGCHAGPRLLQTAPFFEGHFRPSRNRTHPAGLSGTGESAPRSSACSLRSTPGWRSSQSNWNGGELGTVGSMMLHLCGNVSGA